MISQGLRDRGVGLAMAQLVNVLDFATRRIQDGDLLVIHGVEFISDSVREYMSEVINVDYCSVSYRVYIIMLKNVRRNYSINDKSDYTALVI